MHEDLSHQMHCHRTPGSKNCCSQCSWILFVTFGAQRLSVSQYLCRSRTSQCSNLDVFLCLTCPRRWVVSLVPAEMEFMRCIP